MINGAPCNNDSDCCSGFCHSDGDCADPLLPTTTTMAPTTPPPGPDGPPIDDEPPSEMDEPAQEPGRYFWPVWRGVQIGKVLRNRQQER